MLGVGFVVTWLALLAGPIAGAVAVHVLRSRGDGSLSRACRIAGTVLGTVALAILVRIESMSLAINFFAVIAAFLAYCLLASACWTLGSFLVRIIAGTLAYAPLVAGYILGTVGILGLGFILADYLSPPQQARVLRPGVGCVVQGWGNVTSDEGYTVYVYRYLPWIPLLRWEARRVTINETNPLPGLKSATCESVAGR